jgi:hypothetical protein
MQGLGQECSQLDIHSSQKVETTQMRLSGWMATCSKVHQHIGTSYSHDDCHNTDMPQHGGTLQTLCSVREPGRKIPSVTPLIGNV